MLTTEQMKMLKQSNVSKDSAKTQQRMQEDFSSTTNKNKTEIVELSGQARAAFYRIAKTGAANARLVLSMSQVLDVTPYYYIGETDDKEPCSEEILKKFLEERGYTDIIAMVPQDTPVKQKRPYNRKSKENVEETTIDEPDETETVNTVSLDSRPQEHGLETIAPEVNVTTSSYTPTPVVDTEMQRAIIEMTEDDAAYLLKALFMRAKAGGEVRARAEQVKKLLLL